MKHGVAAFKYMQFMTETYGQELVDQMLADHNKPLKRGAADYREIIAESNAKINKIKRTLL